MSYQATVVKVMIAAPNDVEKERDIIREVLDEWNVTDAEHQRVVALPIDWETHASPALGQRPQETINNQVLKTADVLVAVFWTRLGTPTGEHDSGTVEEITKSREVNRPTMVYFSNAAIKPNEIDSEQHKLLKAFRASIETDGLHGSFETDDQFRNKFRRDIRNELQKFAKPIPARQIPGATDSNLDARGTLSEEVRQGQRTARETGLAILLDAFREAEASGRKPWDFAVEVEILRNHGMTNHDFRWLSECGLVEQAKAITKMGCSGRGFHHVTDASFSAGTCLILTKKGVEHATRILSPSSM